MYLISLNVSCVSCERLLRTVLSQSEKSSPRNTSLSIPNGVGFGKMLLYYLCFNIFDPY